MTKLIVKSKSTELVPIEREILKKINDGIIERFYDSSIEGTIKKVGNLVNKWIPRSNKDKQVATQSLASRFPILKKDKQSTYIDFQRQDRALNFPFPAGFIGRVFISSLDGFLNLPVAIPNNSKVRAAGTSFFLRWNWDNNWQSPLLGLLFVKEEIWDSLTVLERDSLEKLLKDWHISKGGKNDDFSSLTSLRSRFLGGDSFYNWATEFNVPINTANVRDLTLAFHGSVNFRYIPWMNTSRVITFASTLNALTRLEALPLFDTVSTTSLSAAFRATAIKTVPPFNTSRVQFFGYTFDQNTQLISFPLINTTAATNFINFCWSCSLSQQSVDNVLISIAAGFAANPTKKLQLSGEKRVLTDGANAQPSNTIRNWLFLQDQTLTLTEGVSWTSVDDNKLVFSGSHRLAMAREVFVESATESSLVGRKLFVIWVSLTEIRLAETLEKALEREFIQIDNSATGGKLYEVYEFNLNVEPWLSLKQIYPNGLTGQEAKAYIATFGTTIETN